MSGVLGAASIRRSAGSRLLALCRGGLHTPKAPLPQALPWMFRLRRERPASGTLWRGAPIPGEVRHIPCGCTPQPATGGRVVISVAHNDAHWERFS
jgi:hypothetical protein